MCIVRTKTRIHSDGRRETVEQRALCSSAVGENLCNRVRREDLGQERVAEIVPEGEPSSSTTKRKPGTFSGGGNPRRIYLDDKIQFDLPLPTFGLVKKTPKRSSLTKVSVHDQSSSQPLERIVEYVPKASMMSSGRQDRPMESSQSSLPSTLPPTLEKYSTMIHEPSKSRSPSREPTQMRIPLRRMRSTGQPPRLELPLSDSASRQVPSSPVASTPGLSRLRDSRHDSGCAFPVVTSHVIDSEHSDRQLARSSLRRKREERDRLYLEQERAREKEIEDERQAAIERGRLSVRDERRAARVHFSPGRTSSSNPESRERHRQSAYERLTAPSPTPKTRPRTHTPEITTRRYHYPDSEPSSPGGMQYRIHRTSFPRSNRSSTSEVVDPRNMDRARAAAARMQDGMNRMQDAMERMSARTEGMRYSDSYHDDARTRRRKKRQSGSEFWTERDNGFFD